MFFPVVLFLCYALTWGFAVAQSPSHKVELRLTQDSTLQFIDPQGKIHQSLALGSVRKRVSIQNTLVLASFGQDDEQHSVIILSLDLKENQPVSFLLEKNILTLSPEAILTLRLSADQTSGQISPSLMGKIWVNGTLLPRNESRKIQIVPARQTSSAPGQEKSPSPDQPKPSLKDFESIPAPSI